MRFVQYILIIAVFCGLLYGIGKVNELRFPVTLTHNAQRPDFYLRNAKLYFQEDEKLRSKNQLASGIEAVEKIHQEADDESDELIAPALQDLREVYAKLPNEIEEVREITIPCIEVLIALTYQQIIFAERLIQSGKMDQVNRAIDYAKSHVKTALVMSEGDRKDSEVMIYAEMDEIVSNPNMPAEEMLAKINKVKEETRDLEISFFH